MIGVVAPVGGVLYDRLGARLLTASGMLICVVALALLCAVWMVRGQPALVMLALALFGVGQGLFISPNNSAIVAAAPASLTGEAGGLLNVTRSLWGQRRRCRRLLAARLAARGADGLRPQHPSRRRAPSVVGRA